MLRGHESLIRLVGKRQRNVSLGECCSPPPPPSPPPPDLKEMPQQEPVCDWVECPVCGKLIRGNGLLINSHLDSCLQNGKKRKKSVQLTLFHFEAEGSSKKKKKKIMDLEEEQTLEIKQEIIPPPPPPPLLDTTSKICEAANPSSSSARQLEEVETIELVEARTQEESIRKVNLYSGSLETRIAGRKYNSQVPCGSGMRVTLAREPDNPKDVFAVKILSPDGLTLGHIPKEISRHLSPLMEQDVVEIEGYVTENVAETSRIKLDLRENKSRSRGSIAAEDNLATQWSNLLDAAGQERGGGSRYQQNFLCMLDTVLGRDTHLFDPDEIELLEKFRSFSPDAQRLLVRLAQRKGPWFRVGNIAYEDIGDVSSAVSELVDGRYLIAAEDKDSAELLQQVTVQELKDLIISGNVMSKRVAMSSKRNQLISAIRDAISSSHFNYSSIREVTGPCIRVSETVEFLLWRIQRLFFLSGEQEFNVFLLVDIGRVKYPNYRCDRTMPVFASREDLLAYEQALQLAQVVDMSLEANDSETLNIACTKARKKLETKTEIKNPFLARFSAAWVYTTICTVAVSFLERERRYGEAVNLLKQLLSMNYCPGRRGYWTLRLSVDLEHLQRSEESLLVAENGLSDCNVRGGDRVALQRRILRLGKPPRRWRIPPFAATLRRKHKVVTITGRPLNSIAGVKSRFYGFDGQQCGVEELALQYYAGEEGGGWKGVHSEGGIWLTLFGLLMWDIIFADVPDVFQTPFQTAPLDLYTDCFYPVRGSLIEPRLQAIRDGGARQIISRSWQEHHGTSCSGVNWEKYSLEDLETISDCIGGAGLSAICKLLAEDRSSWTSGMPDLLLWRETEGEAKLAEVKGPGDRLSEQQIAWFHILSDVEVPVELCKVSKET